MSGVELERGFAAHQAGNFEDAAAHYRRFLKHTPSHAGALANLAVVLQQLGRTQQSLFTLDKALRLAPTHAPLHGMKGDILTAAGKSEAAVAAYRHALSITPRDCAMVLRLTSVLVSLGRHAEAEPVLAAALRHDPDHQDLLEALYNVRAAIAPHAEPRPLTVGSPNGWLALAKRFLFSRQRVSQAAALLEQAIITADAQWPSRAHAYRVLGHAMAGLERPDAALDAFGRSEAILRDIHRTDRAAVDVWWELGSLLYEIGRPDEALAFADEAILKAPQMSFLHAVRGVALRACGRELEGAAAEAKARLLMPGQPRGRPHPAPIWDGQSVPDRIVLVTSDDGFGDFIQSCRFVRLASERARIVLQVPAELRRLVSDLPGAERVVTMDEGPVPAAFRCSVTHLIAALAPAPQSALAEVPYLRVDPATVTVWQERLAHLPNPRVGLVWQGNRQLNWDFLRSMPAGKLEGLRDVEGVSWVSLQAGLTAPEWMHDPMAEVGDFADTAALVLALDLTIAVDTSVVHLAGALGRPVWLLNRFSAEDRWGAGRTDSHLYPTLRQFRQRRPGDWDGVVQEVREALKQWLAANRAEF
jgi:tetratricopeptide (TPR) repeat protein